jgi:H+/Cl- antiporter ClcA
MSARVELNTQEILIFMACWYLFTIITYGTNVPAGLFLPGMIIGCCLGNLYAIVVDELGLVKPEDYDDLTKNFIVLGCAGVMGGYTRMTYSLSVILMETGGTMNLFVPIVFTSLIAN